MKTAATDAVTDVKIYIIAKDALPASKSLNTSNENAEKVVKPPSRPVARNKAIFEFGFCKKKKKSNPIQNEPNTFTANVPYGNCICCPTKNRNKAPKLPPLITRTTLSIVDSISLTVILPSFVLNSPTVSPFRAVHKS